MERIKPDYWEESKKYLAEKDKIIGKVIQAYPAEEYLSKSVDPFTALLQSIVGQQLSVKAAMKIWERFSGLFSELTPEEVKAGEDTLYREQGLSNQKVKYVKNIADFFIKEKIKKNYWKTTPFEKIREDLIQIKGVGHWTVDMFMIFHLNIPDIFPVGDLGILKAVYKLYFEGEKRDKEEILKLSEKWKPYRTVASWYLWRYLDNKPVQY